MIALPQVCEFVHDDHSQAVGRRFLEDRRDADLALGLRLSALHA